MNQPQTSEDGTVSFSGSAQPGSSVELWAGDVKLAVVPVDASGNWAYTGQLPPGDYEIVARTVNAEGETVDELQAVAVQIDVPTPQAEAVVVQIGSISMETGGLVTLSGSTEDGVTVEVWAGETRLASVPVQGDGSWSATVQLVPGDYLVAARSLSPEGEILGEFSFCSSDRDSRSECDCEQAAGRRLRQSQPFRHWRARSIRRNIGGWRHGGYIRG